ncbi:MAG TPA: oxidoreductase [Verrucomicrobia bacterium]|nr:MAG: hypothetical protein A2X46_16230 [Lentisphaerae bacterium GWF2_57_35]HBA83715.1 oxidoreductase [Verrucomicrobiota bacterium]
MDTHNTRVGCPNLDRLPKLGFLGVGWIARLRLKALLESHEAEITALADPSEEALRNTGVLVPEARCGSSLEWLLDQPLDGLVISTPSALHAEHSIAALEAGMAVFCQKPLARTRPEVETVLDAARAANRLLGVDLSYRWVAGVREIKRRIRQGELGLMYAADLVFHNVYGPDKPWYRTLDLAGGGCVMDLGIQLIDLLLWIFYDASVVDIDSRLYSGGRSLDLPAEQVEDYASVRLDLDNGLSARLACSWNLSAGRDCLIGATFYGTGGAMALSNVNGSFYDLRVEEFKGAGVQSIHALDNAWGGRALLDWARHLARDGRYDPVVESIGEVAAVIDGIYGRRTKSHPPASMTAVASAEGKRSVMAEWLSNLQNLRHAGLRVPS